MSGDDAPRGAAPRLRQLAGDAQRNARRATPSFEVPKEGDVFDGKYRVVRKLGEGGMGVVLQAVDEDLSRDVAIKLIRPDCLGDSSARKLFIEEARAMARMRHANIVEVFSFGESRGVPYFVMEYVEGCDLFDYLMQHEDGMVTIDEAIGILSQICLGVHALHTAGTIHQDLKPANVLMGPQFRVAVTDFGLAQYMQKNLETTRLPIGTPPFSPPEVVSGQRIAPELAPRVDVYALGAIGYQLLTGCYAFPIDDTQRLFRYQSDFDPMPPSTVRPELPPAFDEVILSALARDPLRRIPSAEALRQALLDAREITQIRSMVPSCVVCADDDPAFLRWLRSGLSRVAPGTEVVDAPDGQAAIEAIRRRRPALVFSDLQMPGLNGIELTAALRGDPLTKDIPIVVTTAVGGAAEWRTLEKLGASAFLIKPFSLDVLEATAMKLMRTKRVLRR